MSDAESASKSERWLRHARATGAAAAALGAAILIGWAFDIGWLKSVVPRWVTVKPNTAVAILLCGLSFILHAGPRPLSRLRRRAGSAVGAAVLILAVLTIIQSLFRLDLGIDGLLFKEPAGAVLTTIPGRMAAPTMLCLFLMGAALTVGAAGRIGFRISQVAALTVMSVTYFYVLVYVLGIGPGRGLGSGTYMALVTAVALFWLGAALLSLRPERGFLGMLLDHGLEGSIARRLLPVALLVPPFVAAGRIAGERAGLFGSDLGVAIVALTYMILFSILIAWSARSLGRQDGRRRRAEVSIAASEERFRTVAEYTYDWEYWIGPDGRWVYCSPSCERVTGYPSERFLLDPAALSDILLEEDRPRYLKHLSAGAASDYQEFRIRHADGSTRWIGHVCAEIVTPDGRRLGRRASNRDITERKMAMQALQARDELIRQAGDLARVGGWEFDALTGEGTWTDEVARIHDLSPGDPTNMAIGIGFYTGESRARIEAAIRAAIEEGRPYDLELEMTTAAGNRKIVHTIGRPVVEEGRTVRVRGVFQDITDAKRAEEERRRSEAQYRLISENSADVIWILDLATGRFSFVSPSVERLRGYTVEEVMAQGIEAAMKPEDAAWLARQMPVRLAAFAAGDEAARVQTHELDQPRKDGSFVATEIVTTILTDAEGRPDRILGVSRDISERRKAQSERSLTVEFLQMVNASPDIRGLIRSAVEFFHEKSGFEAVGIRLKEGDDYPYYETRGFPEEFVRLEMSLCGQDPDGAPDRGPDGKPIYECMCGNIIEGRADPALPYITAQGGFWSNSTAGLQALMKDDDLPKRVRHRCTGAGYESIGLFPIRFGGATLGLLQLNDHREGLFMPETLGLWERLSHYLAVALSKFQAEDRLRGSEERYRILFENMVEGFAYCRVIWEGEEPVNWIYLAVNKAFEDQTGLRDVVGKAVTEVIPGIREADPGLFEIYGRVARTGQPERFETHVRAMDMWFSVSVYSPAPDHFVAVFDVITARKKAEAEILRLNAELEQRVKDRTAELEAANKELEAFSYSVSHDLRAPLRGIDGWSLALAEDYGSCLDAKGLEYVGRVRSETQRMADLIDDMLTLARVTRTEIQWETIDLSARALSVAARIREAYPGRDVRIDVQPGLKVRADGRLLDVVLTNLIDNACKFTKARKEARIQVGRAEGQGVGVFVVRDNGAGLDLDLARNLFAPFQRYHKASEFPGTGIGLATVQRIIRRHGGTIWAESKPGEGASFFFTLEEST